jgi:hypothetical protein
MQRCYVETSEQRLLMPSWHLPEMPIKPSRIPLMFVVAILVAYGLCRSCVDHPQPVQISVPRYSVKDCSCAYKLRSVDLGRIFERQAMVVAKKP